MADKAIEEDAGLFKTSTSIEKLQDGTCVKRMTKSINGKTEVTEERVDCETALQGVRETDEDGFKKENDDFDERMRDKLKDINTSFTGANNNVTMKEESNGAEKNKVVKVTRESSSIEETKKLEKIPEGTKRTLKITRESFLEETKKELEPNEPEEVTEGVKLLDESFAEEEKSGKPDVGQEATEVEDEDGSAHIKKAVEKYDSGAEAENESASDDQNETGDTRFEDGREAVEEEDSFLKTVFKTILKAIFYPLYKLNIL